MARESGGSIGIAQSALLTERLERRLLRIDGPGVLGGLTLPVLPAALNPGIQVGGPNAAPAYTKYTAPGSSIFSYRGGAMGAYTDSGANTYAGESYVYPNNIAQVAARAVSAAPWHVAFLTNAVHFEISSTNFYTARVFIDGQLVQAPVAATFVGTPAAGNATLTSVANTTGLATGQPVTGPFVQPNTVINSIVTNTSVTLSTTLMSGATGTPTFTAYTQPTSTTMLGSGTPFSPTATLVKTVAGVQGTSTRRIRYNMALTQLYSGNSLIGGNQSGLLFRVDVHGRGPFGGVYVGPQDTIIPLRNPSRRSVLMLGDSYVGSTGADDQLTGLPQAVGHLLGVDVWASGLGGTGYLNAGAYTTLRGRLATDLYPYAQSGAVSAAIIATGINDDGSSGAAVQAEAAAVFSAIAANCGASFPVYVVGPFFQGTASGYSARQTNDTAIATAAAAAPNVVKYLSTQGVVTGTGNTGSRTADGPADHLVGGDGIHPTQMGHEVWGRWIAEQLAGSI